MLIALFPQLPLLRRELTELANRRRTYVIRILGAIALLSVVFFALQISITRFVGIPNLMMPGQTAVGVPGNRYFGIGGTIFSDVVPWLFRCVQLLMPALVCGSITMEKERNTLGTLLLTRLSPFAIVLEKLGSRMIPMFTFLLLTFPVLAYVYSLGGVDTNVLIGTLWLLMCECLLYASIGLMCSSWFMTTVSAFVCSYVIVLLLLMCSGALGFLTVTPFDLWQASYGFARTMGGTVGLRGIPQLIVNLLDATGFVGILVLSIPSLLFSIFCVLISRVFLFRRAFVTSSSPILKLFRSVDRFFIWLNDRTTRGVEIIKDSNTMPTFDPIAWRERTRKSLGKARYLFRVLTVLEVPTIFICALAAIASGASGFAGLRVLLVMLWVLVVLVITVKASTTISSERVKETIEPLLASPMSSRQIVTEKIVGMRRLMIVLSVPVLTIHLTLLLLHHDLTQLIRPGAIQLAGTMLGYVLLTVFATYNAMLFLAWLATGLGMRFLSQTKSVLVAVLLNGTLVVVPLLFALGMWSSVMQFNRGVYYEEIKGARIILVPLCLTPAGPVILTEAFLQESSGFRYHSRSGLFRIETTQGAAFTVAFLVLAIQSAGVFVLRRCVLVLSPRLLNRRDASSHVDGLYGIARAEA